MPYRPAKQNTLLVPSGPENNPDTLHLHIILTNPCDNNCHLVVNSTTIHEGVSYDPACILEPGDHPHIVARSYIIYRKTGTIHTNHLIKCVDGWVYKPRDPVSEEIYERICAGLDGSRFTPRDYKKYLAANRHK